MSNYRQTVLIAFQEVEDNLVALRLLEEELDDQKAAVDAASRYLALATDRYELGIDSYLNVVDGADHAARQSALARQRAAPADVEQRRADQGARRRLGRRRARRRALRFQEVDVDAGRLLVRVLHSRTDPEDGVDAARAGVRRKKPMSASEPRSSSSTARTCSTCSRRRPRSSTT